MVTFFHFFDFHRHKCIILVLWDCENFFQKCWKLLKIWTKMFKDHFLYCGKNCLFCLHSRSEVLMDSPTVRYGLIRFILSVSFSHSMSQHWTVQLKIYSYVKYCFASVFWKGNYSLFEHMSSDKSSISKRNTNPFCFGRKRKSQSKRKLTFSEEKKKKLADSDCGSWFNQEKQWPDKHPRTA